MFLTRKDSLHITKLKSFACFNEVIYKKLSNAFIDSKNQRKVALKIAEIVLAYLKELR